MVKHEIKKFTHYEYWPFWVFYFPLIPYYLWLSIKSKSLLYFTATNPGIRYGGLFHYSKYQLQLALDEKFRPKHQFLSSEDRNHFQLKLDFPIIAKPDFGERGKDVELLENHKHLEAYLKLNKQDILFQEFIDYPLEFGVFYAKFPSDKKGKILSITAKNFLTFRGDGVTSLREFIESDSRAYFNKSYLYMKFHDQQELVLPKGNEMILEEIGNHNRGTYFYDASALISKDLENLIHETVQDINGFYFGRLDMKTKSIEEFKSGNFKVLEVNASNSEATHIYDEKFNILQAYKEVCRHLKIQQKIAVQNMKSGYKTSNFSEFVSSLFQFLFKSDNI